MVGSLWELEMVGRMVGRGGSSHRLNTLDLRQAHAEVVKVRWERVVETG
jgi:hypothetical protein